MRVALISIGGNLVTAFVLKLITMLIHSYWKAFPVIPYGHAFLLVMMVFLLIAVAGKTVVWVSRAAGL